MTMMAIAVGTGTRREKTILRDGRMLKTVWQTVWRMCDVRRATALALLPMRL